MAQKVSEVYDALRSVNVPEDKARSYDDDVAVLKADLATIKGDLVTVKAGFVQMKWMLGCVLAMETVILGRLFFEP